MTFWAGKRVLVTGANGFTGSHLCRALLYAGADVRGLMRPTGSMSHLADLQDGVEWIRCDLADLEGLKKAVLGVDCVFHAAALVSLEDAWASPDVTLQVNSIGAYNVAEAARRSGVEKLLHISTCHVYGNQPESELPIRENTLPRPAEIYAASKFTGEVLVQSVASQGLAVVISRAFAKFGPGQSTRFLIPNIISQLIQDSEVKLGDPRPTRDYSYIEDIVQGYLLMLEKGRAGQIYHLSSQSEISVADVCDRISRICGVQARVSWNQLTRKHDTMRQVGDSTKSRTELGWEPRIGLDEGLRLTVEWWRERLVAGTVV